MDMITWFWSLVIYSPIAYLTYIVFRAFTD
mgnify:CR=1 FL=1